MQQSPVENRRSITPSTHRLPARRSATCCLVMRDGQEKQVLAYSPPPLIFQPLCPISDAIFASAGAIRRFLHSAATVSWQDTAHPPTHWFSPALFCSSSAWPGACQEPASRSQRSRRIFSPGQGVICIIVSLQNQKSQPVVSFSISTSCLSLDLGSLLGRGGYLFGNLQVHVCPGNCICWAQSNTAQSQATCQPAADAIVQPLGQPTKLTARSFYTLRNRQLHN